MAKILVIEDEQNLRLAIHRTLTKSGHEVSEAGCLRDARDLLSRTEFDLVLTDVMLGSETGWTSSGNCGLGVPAAGLTASLSS